MRTSLKSRGVVAVAAAAFGAAGAVGAMQLLGGGSTPVVNFTPAAASDGVRATPLAATNDDPAKANCPGPRQRREPLDDATAAKVKEAALKAVPGATVKRVGHDRRDGYVAMLLKSDGETRVLVHEDKDFNVTKVVDPAPRRPRHPGPHGPRGPRPAAPESAPDAQGSSTSA